MTNRNFMQGGHAMFRSRKAYLSTWSKEEGSCERRRVQLPGKFVRRREVGEAPKESSLVAARRMLGSPPDRDDKTPWPGTPSEVFEPFCIRIRSLGAIYRSSSERRTRPMARLRRARILDGRSEIRRADTHNRPYGAVTRERPRDSLSRRHRFRMNVHGLDLDGWGGVCHLGSGQEAVI